MISPEKPPPIFRPNPYFPESANRRIVTEAELSLLQDRLSNVRLLARSLGHKNAYPDDRDYPYGYTNEIEIPVVPQGTLRAGIEMETEKERRTFIFMNLFYVGGTMKFNSFYPGPGRVDFGYRFSFMDPDEKTLYLMRSQSMRDMNKSEYDKVILMADYVLRSPRPLPDLPDRPAELPQDLR
jgi:hypothetical protein